MFNFMFELLRAVCSIAFASAVWSSDLERRDCDRHGPRLKTTRAILLYPRKRHFTALPTAWRSLKAVLYFSPISIKNKKILTQTAISRHLQ